MLKRVLVANRGEIALRIVRACHDLGIEAVAAHSEADANARFVREADAAVLLGPAQASQSYLSVQRIVAAAQQAGADAVHPGYGFLSENPALARAVIDAGLVFVGPRADTIAALGSKLETRRIMQEAGVPIPPGTDAAADLAQATAQAADIGYPIRVKPSGGGGVGWSLRRSGIAWPAPKDSLADGSGQVEAVPVRPTGAGQLVTPPCGWPQHRSGGGAGARSTAWNPGPGHGRWAQRSGCPGAGVSRCSSGEQA